jgi:hypothetical protein
MAVSPLIELIRHESFRQLACQIKIREKAVISAIGFAMLKGKCIPFLHACDSPPSQTLVIIEATNRVLRRDGKFSARLLAWQTKEERRFLHN